MIDDTNGTASRGAEAVTGQSPTLSDIRWIEFHDVTDDRGRLTAVEAASHVPFPIQRVFWVHQVLEGQERGGHAHQDTDQVAVLVHGTMRIDLSDGINVRTFVLDHPGRGLYLPRLIFTRLYEFSPRAVMVVFASTHYDRSRSIRTWEEYLAARGLPFRPAPFA